MTSAFNLLFNPPGDVAAAREQAHERDCAVWGLKGAVDAIVAGSPFDEYLPAGFRAEQLARALAKCNARLAAADAKYEADMAAWRTREVEADSIPV